MTTNHPVLLIQHPEDTNDYRLHRLIEWAGFSGGDFHKMEVSPGKSYHSIFEDSSQAPTVVMPLGQDAAEWCGLRQNLLLQSRGYVWPGHANSQLLPSVSARFVQRGNAKYSAAFINDIQKAMELNRSGMPPICLDYTLDPSPLVAYDWARDYIRYLAANPLVRLAFDIETPGKGDDEDDLDVEGDAPDRTWNVERIGFSYLPHKALSIPWAPPFMAAIRLCLGTAGDKVVWNAGFDVPRIRRAGCTIEGLIHDGMVAWHILHTDLPKRLGFVATFTDKWRPAWKHLSGSRPAFYNATDADVELISMLEIERGLKAGGLWDVYQKDVLDLEPILVFMNLKGMPVDSEVRLDRAIKLQSESVVVRSAMESAVPLEARKIEKVFKNGPKDTEGLCRRRGSRDVTVCSVCRARKPRKDHFKRFVKKQNPCVDGKLLYVTEEVDEFYRLSQFTPSRDQLLRYHQFVKRALPMVYDKKTRTRRVSFGERQIRELAGHYPDDKLYYLILRYRELDKLSGTYVGRVVYD